MNYVSTLTPDVWENAVQSARAPLDFYQLGNGEVAQSIRRMQASKIQPRQNGFDCESCGFLNNRCITGGLPKDTLRGLFSSVVFYEIKRKGGYVFNQGQLSDGFFFLCSGSVKLVTALENGQEVILDLLSAPSLIGGAPVNTTTHHEYSAVVISESARIAYAKQGVVEKWIRSEPVLGIAFFHHSWGKLQNSYTLISRRVYDVRTRFLLLVSYYMSVLKPNGGRELLEIQLSQEELAGLVQATPETISRLLHCLKDEGLVTLTKRRGVVTVRSKILCEFLAKYNDAVGSSVWPPPADRFCRVY